MIGATMCTRYLRILSLGLTLTIAMLLSFGTATAEPVMRYSFVVDPFVTVNPCNDEELLQISGEITAVEKDTIREGSEHFLRQFRETSTVLNLTTGDTYELVGHSTNIYVWPDETGDPPLTYIFRSRSTYIDPGSGAVIVFRETIRMVVNPDGTITMDVFNRVISCR